MRRQRGFILVQAVIVGILVALVSALVWKLAIGRRVLSQKERTSAQARAVSEAAHLRASQCLQTLEWTCGAAVPVNCAACGGACSQFFGAYDLTFPGQTISHQVTVDLVQAGGRCQIKTQCTSCL